MKVTTLKLVLIIGFLFYGINAISQTITDDVYNKKIDTLNLSKEKKLKFGAGFGLSFVGGTNISVSPNLTYKVSEKIAVGVGVQFNYLALKDIQTTISYGANTVFQYQPIKQIVTLVEFVQLKVSSESKIDGTENDFWDSALFAGAGYNITEKISVGAKYNFLYNEDESIYSSPVIPFVNISF